MSDEERFWEGTIIRQRQVAWSEPSRSSSILARQDWHVKLHAIIQFHLKVIYQVKSKISNPICTVVQIP